VNRAGAVALLASLFFHPLRAPAEDVELPSRAEEPPAADASPFLGPQLPEHLLKITHTIGRKHVDLPILIVRVNGRPCWLLLDTGASTHVLSQRLIRALGLSPSRDGFGKDHLGNDFAAGMVEGVTIESEGWALVDHGPVGTADLSGTLEELGIDGLLSPQMLAPAGESVVLDLAGGLLWTAPHVDAEAQFRGKRLRLTPPWPRICTRSARSPFQLYVLPAIIEGTAQSLLIDTGATHTNLSLSALQGTRLVPSASGRGRAAAGRGQRLRAADLRIGRLQASRDIPLVPGSPNVACRYDGVLGLDILSTCTLVLNPSQAGIGCL